MFKTEELRSLVNERLQAAAEDVFRLFERTIKDYEQVCRSTLEMQQRRLPGEWKDPLQLKKPEEEQQQSERITLGENSKERPQIKEEQEEVWTAQSRDELEEADTLDMFNIIYVQRRDEDERKTPHESQIVENKVRSPLPSNSAEPMTAENNKNNESCGASESTSDCQSFSSHHSIVASEDGDGDEEWRDSGGLQSCVNRKKSQQAELMKCSALNVSVIFL
ncbi:hypothetical protein LDENG_00193010 [Lucifuga dentata]|nr:hypothetical protein LDENG_00193010 [Lucifuga dentata]